MSIDSGYFHDPEDPKDFEEDMEEDQASTESMDVRIERYQAAGEDIPIDPWSKQFIDDLIAVRAGMVENCQNLDKTNRELLYACKDARLIITKLMRGVNSESLWSYIEIVDAAIKKAE